MRFRFWVLGLIAVLALAAAGCGKKDKASEAGGVKRSDINIQVVTHGQASDPFWSVVQNGVDQAKKDLGVKVTYRSPQKFDVVAMRQLIDSAIATKPDGLAVSLPDPTALGPSVTKAIKAGIPVVTLNSGSDVSAKLGALAHVGQPEREAGLAAGTSAKSRVTNVLKKRPQVDGILTLGPTGADPTIAALKDTGKFGKIKIGTFDLSPSVLDAVNKGDLLFAVDQQQFLQGYLPVEFLAQYAQLGVSPVGQVKTGPGFVTKANAAKAIKLTKEGLR